MPPLTVQRLDELLLASHPRLEADRRVAAADWAEHLRTLTPEPAFYDVFSRRGWRAAFEVASKMAVKTRTFVTLVLPVWSANNEDEVDGAEWVRGALLVFEDGDFLDLPGGFDEDALVVARVERAERPRIVPADYLAPSYPTKYRDDERAVVLGDNAERVVAVVSEHLLAPVSKPTRVVRAFSAEMEAAIDLDAAMPVLRDLGASDVRATYREHGADKWRALIEAALAEQRFEPDDDGEWEGREDPAG